jgi:hypothetical protein
VEREIEDALSRVEREIQGALSRVERETQDAPQFQLKRKGILFVGR